ncbi:MAG: hypothetical protein ACI9SG_002588 [Maribacter sp.]|jgi:uncharacterized protein (TIGR03643 family)
MPNSRAKIKSNDALYLCTVMEKKFTARELDRIIEMAWEDRTTFDAISFQFGISEQETIEIMRREMKPSSFRMWRKRVQGRATKHAKLRTDGVDRFKCSRQKQITGNKISKR